MAACLKRRKCPEVIIVHPAGELGPFDGFELATRNLQRFFGRRRARKPEDRVDKEPKTLRVHALCQFVAPTAGDGSRLICRLLRSDGSKRADLVVLYYLLIRAYFAQARAGGLVQQGVRCPLTA